MPRDFIGSKSTVVASAARTASGNSASLPDYGDDTTLRCQLDVTAVAGTAPTLDVVIEDTLDGTNFHTLGSFTQRTATGVGTPLNITTPFSDTLRVRWTLGGAAPSFTFSVIVFAE